MTKNIALQPYSSSPVLLSADRFTPPTRTPWAGHEIARQFKDEIIHSDKEMRIGESWEFSCDPEFPSLIAGTDIRVMDLIASYPTEILSPAQTEKTGISAEILVKLLNADEPLSLQVHPSDDDKSLKPNECGKPESWLVLDAKPGAGLYLGFARELSKDKLRTLLGDGDRCKEYLQFVPVKPGDYFDLAAGVPHAIGPGVTLLEPQRILSGQSGKTYRLWDWGRKYDSTGHLDMENGKARELHIEQGLKLINPMRQVGLDFVNSIRRQPVIHDFGNGGFCARYAQNLNYGVDLLELNDGDKLKLVIEDGYGILISLAGHLHIDSHGKKIDVIKGQPVLLPYDAMPLSVSAEHKAKFALVVPGGANVLYH